MPLQRVVSGPKTTNGPHRGDGGSSKTEASEDPLADFREINSRGYSGVTEWCTGCQQWLAVEAFAGAADRVRCGSCRAEVNRRWRAQNPEAVAAYNESRRIGPRECTCVDCGAVFTAGKRGPVRTRCAGCRAKADSRRPRRRRPRVCEVCGSRYRPSYGAQRTCGRSCGVILREQRRKAAA
jgi:hypothetical protein